MVTIQGVEYELIPKLTIDNDYNTRVGDQIMEAVKDMNKDGWCTGVLFKPGGAGCAVGNLLKTVGVTREPDPVINDQGFINEAPDFKEKTYGHPGIQDAMRELAKDIRADEDYQRIYGHEDYDQGFQIHQVVWHYNDGVGRTVEKVSTQFLKTARRLYGATYSARRL